MKRLGVFISHVFVGEKSQQFFFVSLKMILLKNKIKNFITILLIYLSFLTDEVESGVNWVQN